jgi:hypothetical protein
VIVVDSTVWVSRFMPHDIFHERSRRWLSAHAAPGGRAGVISYYLYHRPHVDAYLREREQQAAAVRRENEARFDPRGVRERLRTRRSTPEWEGQVRYQPL